MVMEGCRVGARMKAEVHVVVLQFADAAGRGAELTPPPFHQHDMPHLRMKVTADIMRQRVD